jgi:hypothetical protein
MFRWLIGGIAKFLVRFPYKVCIIVSCYFIFNVLIIYIHVQRMDGELCMKFCYEIKNDHHLVN